MTRALMPVGIPTGFLVRGPDGNPVLMEFDSAGKAVTSGGTVMRMQGWLLEYGDAMPDDAVVLVEHARSDNGLFAMKPLDSGLFRDGARRVTVGELYNKGELVSKVERFRAEYMERTFG